jgi:pyruvate/2-oxoglutarate dehydrogenase complex dihydrolipoamide dehydrogenase (E3) component
MDGPSQILPATGENHALLDNVHPSGWVNPEPATCYNLVVIGAGTAGLVCAAGAASLGAKVALIERHLLGGDCLNYGCVPSKGIIRSARAVSDARRGEEFGFSCGERAEADFAQVMARMRKIRAGLSPHDSARRFRDELGVDLFFGTGTFTGADSIVVEGKSLRFKRAAICTGARAVPPPFPGIGEAGFLTNETVFSLTSLPRRLAVIGSGPIGCELAQTFALLGSQVTIIERGSHILPREDRDAADIVKSAFILDGVRLALETKTVSVARKGDEKVISAEHGGKEIEIAVDEILVGVGRAPNMDGLGLEAAGIAFDPQQGVKVDELLRTSNPRVYAAGDICFPYKFTHTADALARIVIANALFMGRQKSSALVVPWCTYTDPEVAHVGLYEQEARGRGIGVTTITVPLNDVDRAVLDGETEGFARVHLKKGSDRILGATIVARHAGEMISEMTLAMTSGLGLSAIGRTIHPYPTQAEALKKLADAYNRTRLTPFVRKTLASWLRLMRG